MVQLFRKFNLAVVMCRDISKGYYGNPQVIDFIYFVSYVSVLWSQEFAQIIRALFKDQLTLFVKQVSVVAIENLHCLNKFIWVLHLNFFYSFLLWLVMFSRVCEDTFALA